jgi:hypothetical protein
MLTASPCSWLSQPQSNISQSDFRRIFGTSSLAARLHLLLPFRMRRISLVHALSLCQHAVGTNPGDTHVSLPERMHEYGLPEREKWSAVSQLVLYRG